MLKNLKVAGGCLVALALTASSAAAEPIVWFGSNEVESVITPSNALVTLTVGTPWSLSINFDSSAPATVIRGIPGCNQFPVISSTFTLGPYTYNSTGGQFMAQHGYPSSACDAPVSLAGLLQAVLPIGPSSDPNAWPFGGTNLLINFFGAPPDGSLPAEPPSVSSAFLFGYGYGGLYWRGLGNGEFQAVVDQPTPVPEPGTLTLFALGLAAAARNVRKARLT
jgi:hypothetical protein